MGGADQSATAYRRNAGMWEGDQRSIGAIPALINP